MSTPRHDVGSSRSAPFDAAGLRDDDSHEPFHPRAAERFQPYGSLPMKTFGRFVIGSIAAGFVILIIVGAATFWLILRTQENTEWVTHSFEVELALADFKSLSERAEASRRGFLVDPDEEFVTLFEEIAVLLPRSLQGLATLVSDNPDQAEGIERLKALSNEHIGLLRQSIADRRQMTAGAAVPFVWDQTTQVIAEVRSQADAVSTAERQLLAERTARQQRTVRASYVVIALAALTLLIVAAGTIWATRRNLLALQTSRDSLGLLNEDLEGAVATRTADLQRANDEIQRFAYIVSHDLRSPLVNVMGFTSELDAATKPLADLIDRVELEAPDLLTEDTKLAVREDLPEAIGFIRSSTQKMDRLINAILRLSREGRRVIMPEPLDMNELVTGIEESLHHRLTEIGARIEIARLPPLVSDRVAVEQIFSNLVENAVKYLKPGRPGVVKVRGKRQGNRVLFEIEDNGRGIDPKDHDRIFDLFRRSGSQDQPGEGIGLAHVRALVYRLGGVIGCQSALDEGATFRLSMRADLETAEGLKST